MSLPYEYFESQTHITDLKKLKDDEIYYIIYSFYDELEKCRLNKHHGVYELKGLAILCDKTTDIIKDIRFILNGFINALKEKCIMYCLESDITRLLSDMDKIENQLNILKSFRLKRANIDKLASDILLHIRLLHLSLSELIFMEKIVWDSKNKKNSCEGK